MNKDQGGGVVERVIYSAILWLAMQGAARGWWDTEMASYIAAGGVALVGGAYGWYHNRPAAVLSRAGNAVPENAKLVITTTASATRDEKNEAHALADSANEKVTAKTTS